jgi:hypothetical protein
MLSPPTARAERAPRHCPHQGLGPIYPTECIARRCRFIRTRRYDQGADKGAFHQLRGYALRRADCQSDREESSGNALGLRPALSNMWDVRSSLDRDQNKGLSWVGSDRSRLARPTIVVRPKTVAIDLVRLSQGLRTFLNRIEDGRSRRKPLHQALHKWPTHRSGPGPCELPQERLAA